MQSGPSYRDPPPAASIDAGHRTDLAGKLMMALVVLVILHALVYWILLAMQYPTVPLSVLTMFRRGGDPDYYPMIATLAQAKVGEIMVLEKSGTGVMSFPIASMALHGLASRWMGAAGFIVADVAVAVLYFLAVTLLLRAAGIPAVYAAIISFLIATSFDFASDLFSQAVAYRISPLVQFWGPRLPRPYVSEIFVVAILAIQIHVARARERRYRLLAWGGLGVAYAAIVQSDFHFAFILGLGIMVQVLALFLVNGQQRRDLIRCVLAFLAAAAVCAVPFMLQRLFENPEVPVRYGVFAVSRLHPLTNWGSDLWRVVACLAVMAFAAWVTARSSGGDASGRRHVLALFSVLIALAYIALPLSCVLIGKAVQIYHFRECLKTLTSYLLLVAGIWMVGAIIRIDWSKLIRLAASVAIGVAVAIHAWAAVSLKPYEIASDSYVRNLGLLSRELSSKTYQDCRVVGTLDYLVATWWVVFHHDPIYVPLNLGTTVDDATLELRLARFCKLIGVMEKHFVPLLRIPNQNSRWLGSNKYTASRVHAMRPLDDYTPEDQSRIARTGVDSWSDSWNLALPISEQHRLTDLFAQTDMNPPANERLDLIVIGKSGVLSGRAPPAVGWTMTYENDEFRVWRRVVPLAP